MVKKYQMFINGEWVDSETSKILNVYNPYNQEVWATIPQASERDAEYAIKSANNAFHKEWKYVTGKERAELLYKLAELIDSNAEYLSEIESKNNGKIILETRSQMHFAARNYRYFAGYADKLHGDVIPMDNPDLFDYTIVEPLGVAVLITAWNSPITLLANKLAPALATGNAVVIKPSEHASASTLEFGKLVEKAGFPKGVVNIVTGDGNVGSALTKSPDVQKISFTGGLSTAKLISRNASENLIPVTTELGGKSPNIIFADSDIEHAVIGAIAGIFGASGQSCIAGSRLLVEETIYEEVLEKVVKMAEKIKLGNPLDLETEMGPVANQMQYERILSIIKEAEDEGGDLLCGGSASEKDLQNGYFIKPTIFGNVDSSMKISQVEVFGPVLCVMKFKDEEEAIRMANDTSFGLASGIWTNNLKRAHRMARNIEAGTVWLNTYRTTGVGAPFGGTKLSGNGTERSWHALFDYTQVKNVMLDLSNEPRNPFSIRV